MITSPARAQVVLLACTGTCLGFSLSRAGFTDYAEVRAMFTFGDLRLFLAFIGGVVLTAVSLRLVARGRPLPSRSIHRGTVLGGVLFGLGWAISGGCPAIPFVQLGEGQGAALITLIGVVMGIFAWRRLNRRLGWQTGSCSG
jgi:uncharacterized membrane protein YedE/YeeE